MCLLVREVGAPVWRPRSPSPLQSQEPAPSQGSLGQARPDSRRGPSTSPAGGLLPPQPGFCAVVLRLTPQVTLPLGPPAWSWPQPAELCGLGTRLAQWLGHCSTHSPYQSPGRLLPHQWGQCWHCHCLYQTPRPLLCPSPLCILVWGICSTSSRCLRATPRPSPCSPRGLPGTDRSHLPLRPGVVLASPRDENRKC